MSTKYEYNITSSFPNSIMNEERLSKEIRESGISTSLDFIGKTFNNCDIWFKADLSTKDKTTLDGVVAVHSGEMLEDPAQVYDRNTGKMRVHQTSRQPGTKTFFTGASDDPTNITDVGNGEKWAGVHRSGDDPVDQSIYLDFNAITNETWIHEAYITWKDALLDTVTIDIVPEITSFEISGIGDSVQTGSGLNDLDTTSYSTLNLLYPTTYRIQIDDDATPDTFRWSSDGGVTWNGTDIPITGELQQLEYGIGIVFNATTGHTLGDYWEIRVVPENTTFNLYGGYLIIPAAGDGNIFVTSDITQPHGGFVESSANEDGVRPTSFWNADFNATTGLFENITPAPYGDGGFNLFAAEVKLGRFVNAIPLLGSGFVMLQTSDVDRWSHGWRAKFKLHTNIDAGSGFVDHDWFVSMFIVLHRARSI